MKDIKDYREREQSLYIIANVLIFLIVYNFIDVSAKDFADTANVLSDLFNSIVFSVIAFGFIFVVECLFKSQTKEKLLYLFGLLHLPSFSIFSDIRKSNRDNRFSYQTLVEKYPSIYANLPSESKTKRCYENENWYLIYSKIRDASMIQVSQRDSLMCRDIYISTVVILLLYLVIVAIRLVCFNLGYLLFLIILLIITNIGANRKASRFAYNVIAYDITQKRKENKE